MARQDNLYGGGSAPLTEPKSASAKAGDTRADWTRRGWFRLLALALLVELFQPFLRWPIGLPRILDATLEIMPAVLLMLTFLYMLKEDRIPGAVPFILGITLVWALVATFEGQFASATIWGWWGVFKYPIVGLFAYLVPRWPRDFSRWFLRFCIGLQIFEIGVQLVMLAAGYPMGDSLAGTFGWKGVMQYSMVTFFVLCMALGAWLATFNWKTLILVLSLGMLGSTLSGTKFYLLAAGLLLITTLFVHLVRGGQFRQLVIYVVMFAVAAMIFVPLYNSILVNRQGLKPLQEYLQPDTLERYLFEEAENQGTYYLGRGLALTYGWQQVQRDFTTTLFGFGLGTRAESNVLGIEGVSLQEDLYGGVSTTTLSEWLQEFGVVGLVVFFLFTLWVALKLFNFARATTDRNQAALAYGLMLFTFYWPVWLWYHKAWTGGAMMVLYWVSLGYIFQRIYLPRRRSARRR